jgi:hypothetical protein
MYNNVLCSRILQSLQICQLRGRALERVTSLANSKPRTVSLNRLTRNTTPSDQNIYTTRPAPATLHPRARNWSEYVRNAQ